MRGLIPPVDRDFDGDTKLVNFASFQTCFTANTGSAPSGCEMMDMDGNGTVDVTDFTTFRASLGGPP